MSPSAMQAIERAVLDGVADERRLFVQQTRLCQEVEIARHALKMDPSNVKKAIQLTDREHYYKRTSDQMRQLLIRNNKINHLYGVALGIERTA